MIGLASASCSRVGCLAGFFHDSRARRSSLLDVATMALLDSVPSIAILAISAVVLYFATHAIYNLYFHPLSQHPGPILNAISPLPRLYWNIEGREPQTVLKLHLKYGNIVRIAPNELSFITQAWKDIYGFKRPELSKDWTMYALSENTKRSIILSGTDHGRQRKMLAPAFSERALKLQQGMLTTYTGMMVEKLEERMKESKSVDMAKVFNCVTFDTIADLMFGEPLGLCENMEYSDWLSQLFVSIWLAGASRALQYFPLLFRLATMMIPKHIQETIDSSYQNTVDKVNKRLAMKTERPDMLGLMLKHKEEGAEMTMDELYANADLLMIAGTETTATSLSGLTWYLLNNKPVLERLTKEVREAFNSIDDITMESLPRLPVKVSIPHYAAYHHPTNFHSPTTFAPERWLLSSHPLYNPIFASDKKEILQPFSVGPRNCIGLTLAYHEMRLIMANLLWHFDVELSGECDEGWLDQSSHLVWDKKPLMVKILARGSVA
ncbi:putative cytochrome P450 monooxygenase [Aureobasidium pullulans]|uniref:Putative cytochrome P450 monooxygenase n=1 Tax=Aureobasidium pullulans TaxID=5580 RepID=A0A4S9XMT0_AURPU|nr:putative cytochrome P450 monooxygenase [Aureobasidium pullulans]